MTNTIEIKDMDKLCTAMGGAVDLDDLADVAVTAPDSGEVLQYDGAAWVNAEISEVPDASGASAGDILTVGADGPEWSTPAGIWVPVPEAAEAGYILTAKADGTVEWVNPEA